MTKQKGLYRLPRDSGIPIELAKLVGLITIRVGELERLLMSVYHQKLEPQRNILDVIAELKTEFKTLANRIRHIKGKFEERKIPIPDWLNFDNLTELAKKRNAIYDSLLIHEEGFLCWLSSSENRDHRKADSSDLKDLLNCLNGTLFQIEANLNKKENP